jgi:hypothetical protein
MYIFCIHLEDICLARKASNLDMIYAKEKYFRIYFLLLCRQFATGHYMAPQKKSLFNIDFCTERSIREIYRLLGRFLSGKGGDT